MIISLEEINPIKHLNAPLQSINYVILGSQKKVKSGNFIDAIYK